MCCVQATRATAVAPPPLPKPQQALSASIAVCAHRVHFILDVPVCMVPCASVLSSVLDGACAHLIVRTLSGFV